MKDFKTILKAVAQKNNTTTEDVLRLMEVAIAMGMADPDPEVQEKWRQIPPKGDQPTPEEVIMYYAKLLKPSNGIMQ